ncbi:MAG: CRISPR-associated endonuclease Cas2 [Deltaproteobacteria bacterium]|nr:CRISPR-associated endonuclease Cas2 [Deltaproteobacteria bacterium]
MAEKRRWWLLTYDVRDPKRWRGVYQQLRGVGERVQYSVFRARMSERELQRLRWQLEKRMAPEDSLLIIGLCTGCSGKVISRGEIATEAWDEEPPRWQIV